MAVAVTPTASSPGSLRGSALNGSARRGPSSPTLSPPVPYSPASGLSASPKRAMGAPMRSINDRYRLHARRSSGPRPA